MAAVLGAGPVADAFFVAFRLPNHFRAILAEGAFNAAFVPAYARTLEQSGLPAARLFSDRIAAALLVINLFLLGLALVFTPSVVSLLAPGLDQDPTRYDLAVTLTRVTFPALLLVSMQTMISGELNANGRFAAAAGAPILLNICMVLTLSVAYWFPNAGLAAAWGVLSAGVAQVLLVGVDAERSGFGLRFRVPRLDGPTRRFLKALGPAIIGAGGVQLALFADTLIASFLPTGALSALYYADRINQLPIGVVGIAVGTVLLPEMSRRLAAGDVRGAASAQARGIQLALLLTVPCAAAAIGVPELIMRALFARGAFTIADAAAAAPFYARGDTLTPVKATLLAASVNVALKVILMGPLAQVGLAFATSVGAWINLTLLWFFARRQGLAVSGAGLRPVLKLLGAGVVLGISLYLGNLAIAHALAAMPHLREETTLALLILLGGAIYAVVVLLLLGRNWPHNLLKSVGASADRALPPKRSPIPSDQGGAYTATQETPASRDDILERL
jgi:putative peptidoglycan lipid II flippase